MILSLPYLFLFIFVSPLNLTHVQALADVLTQMITPLNHYLSKTPPTAGGNIGGVISNIKMSLVSPGSLSVQL